MNAYTILALFVTSSVAQPGSSMARPGGLAGSPCHQCWHFVSRLSPVVGFNQRCWGQSFPDPFASVLPSVVRGSDVSGPICNSQNCKLDARGYGPICI
ncbi:hypothetical protein BCR33DRAFT_730646 [Rhizoclosmatium globosum]|uniref:CBM1 domain-containing protein n=1 Tax=Rhizoclosmatium globosum TaxID=329046 RepID=A0A1Y2ADC4_9FUNG|nr:hypothetical protein BCR33DRAFT_730646 [Rhizoclosmatium globosum]|eukprot:ORY19985.1 hypothetical protein BCR33DRAFT_730646 [Rhizoclosmatium globosum]